jgi:hypothetical protein
MEAHSTFLDHALVDPAETVLEAPAELGERYENAA